MKMFKHLIVVGNAFAQGKRICLHFVDKSIDSFFNYYNNLSNETKDLYVLSFHIVETSEKSFASVQKKDAFFEDVKEIKSINSFFRLLNKNADISAVDVAYYIISEHAYCHTKIQKLVYLCYADYMVKYGKKLFLEPIEAWTYGPVVQAVYNKLRKYASTDDTKTKLKYNNMDLVMRTRIMNSEDGVNKLDSIDDTLRKYENFAPGELVALTHKKNTPWDYTKNIVNGKIISDDAILNYHINEAAL